MREAAGSRSCLWVLFSSLLSSGFLLVVGLCCKNLRRTEVRLLRARGRPRRPGWRSATRVVAGVQPTTVRGTGYGLFFLTGKKVLLLWRRHLTSIANLIPSSLSLHHWTLPPWTIAQKPAKQGIIQLNETNGSMNCSREEWTWAHKGKEMRGGEWQPEVWVCLPEFYCTCK